MAVSNGVGLVPVFDSGGGGSSSASSIGSGGSAGFGATGGASPSPGLKRPWPDWQRGAGALAGQPLSPLLWVARQASELPVKASPSAGLKRPWPAWHRQAGALAGQLGVGLLIRQWGPASRLRD